MSRVIITTFNRPRSLFRLLVDLAEEHARDVRIYDDGSTANYGDARAMAQEQGWHFETVPHYGKARYWQLLAYIYHQERANPAEWYYFLPDDVRLCHRFGERSRLAWAAASAPITLNLLRDSGRDGKPNWTGVLPRVLNPRVLETGWVDGAFMAHRRYLEALDFNVPQVPEDWQRPGRGSGAFRGITLELHQKGLRMCQVTQSLVVHAEGPSVMNPDHRGAEPLRTVDYIDGHVAGAMLAHENDSVTAALATLPDRVALLERTVASLLPQVDKLCVALNGHGQAPDFLSRLSRHGVDADSKIRWCMVANEWGDAAKFLWADLAPGYYLSCDDDIIYPPNYVREMIAGVERYQRRAAVAVLGRTLKAKVKSYYADYELRTKVRAGLDKDTPMHVLGTGTLAWYAPALRLSLDDFPVPNMADVWFSIAAKKAGMPCFAVRRPKRWLDIQETPPGTTIYEKYKQSKDDSVQTRAVNEAAPWPSLAGLDRDMVLRTQPASPELRRLLEQALSREPEETP